MGVAVKVVGVPERFRLESLLPLRICIKSQSDKPHFCSPTMQQKPNESCRQASAPGAGRKLVKRAALLKGGKLLQDLPTRLVSWKSEKKLFPPTYSPPLDSVQAEKS